MSIKGFVILLKHMKAVKHSCRWSERVKVEKESLRHEVTPRLGRNLTAGSDRSSQVILVNLSVLHNHDEVFCRILDQFDILQRIAVDQK